MTISRIATPLITLMGTIAGIVICSTVLAATNDRVYSLGDHTAPPNPSENASNGAAVGSGNAFGTLDSAGLNGMDQLPPLNPVGSPLPVYRTISGRPDGGGGLGIEFNGAQSQYVHGRSLNLPSDSLSALGGDFPGTLNYTGINNRGFQLWVRPGAGASGAQSLVMDSNQHGVRITAGGDFSMRYAGSDFDTSVAATPGTWYHVMVVRPEGVAGGSRMYVDGVAVAVGPGGYDGADESDLVLGSNTAGGDGFDETGQPGGDGFTGGTGEYYTGILDDLTMFVIGESTEVEDDPETPENEFAAGVDFGGFDFATDNAFAAFTLTGVAGDLNNNGALDPSDKTNFINGWRNENVINTIRVPDLNSYAAGDLNFDGITNIFDLALMQDALASSGFARITSAELAGVPEPTTAALMLLGLFAGGAGLRRR